MRVALLVNRVGSELDVNLSDILEQVNEACDRGAQLLVLPEAAYTGLFNDDNPAHDLPLGQPIPGMLTRELGRACHDRQVWLACGLLECEGSRLFDTAVIIAPDRHVHLKYRRIQPQWHGRKADPQVYLQGDVMPVTETPFGRMACLICGDLFDDGVVGRVRACKPDWLLMPFTRCFKDGSFDQARWDLDEMPSYCQRIAMTGCTTFMVNYLAERELNDGSFGGAEVVSGDGRRLAHYPLGTAGMLIVDVEKEQRLEVKVR
jgi:N-carbamoylputrescine amidase